MSWFKRLDQPTASSVTSFVISFFLILFYLSYNRPDYILDKDKPLESKVSYRLLIVYTLLWSSTIALFVFCVNYLSHTLRKKI